MVAFCHTLQDFAISKQDSLEKVLATARSFRMGSTDCSLPMSYARQKGLDVDAFIVLTDNETCTPLLCYCVSCYWYSPLKTWTPQTKLRKSATKTATGHNHK